MHELTKENIERMNAKYKLVGDKGRKRVVFAPGDLVWLHLRKDRFTNLHKTKLMPRADGPFKVLEKINDNAYKLELPADFGVSPTLTLQIRSLTWVRKMNFHRGRLKFKKGRMMRTSLTKLHPHPLLIHIQDQLLELAHAN